MGATLLVPGEMETYTGTGALLGLQRAKQWLHGSRCLGSLMPAAIPVLWQAGFALSLSLFKHPHVSDGAALKSCAVPTSA